MIPSIRSRIQMSVGSNRSHWKENGLSYVAWPFLPRYSLWSTFRGTATVHFTL